jgi:hypothetical protein
VFGGLGGVDVVVDRSLLELGDRHIDPPAHGDVGALDPVAVVVHMLCHNHSRTFVQECRAEI